MRNTCPSVVDAGDDGVVDGEHVEDRAVERLAEELRDAGQLDAEQYVPVIEGGDLDPGELFAVLTAGDDVVKIGFAVRGDGVAAQALPDDVLGEPIGDPVGARRPNRTGSARGSDRCASRPAAWRLASEPADLKGGEWPALLEPVREFGRFVQEHRGELIADGLGVGAAVGEQRCCGAVQPWCDRSEENVLGACAVVPEALRERLGQLEQPLALRCDTKRSVRPRRAAAEPVDQARLGGFGGHAELGERAAGELVGLGEESEDEMLRAQVVMTVFARRRSGSKEHVGGGSPQSGREITGRRRAERDITLLSGLLRHS